MEQEDEKKEKPVTAKAFKDLVMALDSQATHTSFGQLPLSVEPTAPQYSFPKAKLDDGDKVFVSEEMARTTGSKHAPGPAYMYDDNTKYSDPPKFGFGTSSKLGEIKPKYDFYENDRFFDDPIEADHARKKKCCAPKIGTEPRMPANTFEKTPGPQYMPGDKPNKKQSQKFTFGFRRSKGDQDSLVNKVSTTKAVGPGRYVPEASINPSTKKDFPKWTLPKAGRGGNQYRKVDKNQTYDTRSSVGNQYLSKNKSGPSAHFGTSNRAARTGQFKDGMTGAMKVKMPHASY